MTPPTFRTTITFLPLAWKEVLTFWRSSRSTAVSSKSSIILRSAPSPALRPSTTTATSLALDSAAMASAGMATSESLRLKNQEKPLLFRPFWALS